MKINILGTADAISLNCYNTCFTISEGEEHFLIDCGGGNGILKQLKSKNIKITNITNIFITHTHTDHILGIIWVLRMICRAYFYGELNTKSTIKIYGNDEVINAIDVMSRCVLPPKFYNLIGNQIKLIEVKSGDEVIILNKKVKFFDINASKVKQFGFYMYYEKNKKFVFLGDECYNEKSQKYVEDCEWLFADAFMAGEEGDRYNPMEKHHHSTVRYISTIAQNLNVKNLILSHIKSEDVSFELENRKQIFEEDAKKYYEGKVYVPDDLDEIELK